MAPFIEVVRRHGEFDSDDEARRAARASLTALGERIAHGEAEDVAAHLSDEAADWVTTDGPATSLSAEEFVALVADRADADRDRAYDYVEATFGALSDRIPEAEFEGVVTQLPPSYDPLLVEA